MISRKPSLITPVDTGFIPSIRSYWATHFYSIIQCIHTHNTLQYSPHKLHTYPEYTLGMLRGHFPVNFFETVETYIKNWGVQYFLANFFNQKLGGNVVDQLISHIEAMYDVKFSRGLNYFSFHVSGNDSDLSSALRGGHFEVFPNTLNGMRTNANTLIANSDLCLMLTDQDRGINVGVFGEVEGIYGNKLRNETYWSKKHNSCIFGIGVVDGNEKKVYIQDHYKNGAWRTILTFERSNLIISDFMKALWGIKSLFLSGPLINTPTLDEEFGFFVNELKKNWHKSINDLMRTLKQYISNEDLVGFNNSSLTVITSLQSSPKI